MNCRNILLEVFLSTALRLLHKMIHAACHCSEVFQFLKLFSRNKANAGFSLPQVHRDGKLQAGALLAIGNLVHRHDSNAIERHARLKELGIVNKLEELLSMTAKETEFYEE